MANPIETVMTELTRVVAVKPTWHFEPAMLRRLDRLKLVEKMKVVGRPPTTVMDPLWVFRPGDPLPPHERIAWAAQKRLKPPQEYTVVRASQRGCNIFGGSVVRWNPTQIYHDTMKSSVLEAWRAAGRRTDLWVGEHRLGSLAKLLPKVPDAFVLLQDRAVIVEVIGDYPPSRIREFVESLDGYGFEIELW
jgi:hypothetical protein